MIWTVSTTCSIMEFDMELYTQLCKWLLLAENKCNRVTQWICDQIKCYREHYQRRMTLHNHNYVQCRVELAKKKTATN